MAKKKIVVETKYTTKGAGDVGNAYNKIGDSAKEASTSTDKVNESIKETGEASKGAESGIGGLLDKFKAIVTNPIGLAILALVGAIKFVSEALAGSEDASNKLAQGFAYLKGFILPLQKAVLVGFDLIVEAVSSPGKAFDAMITGIEKGVDFFNSNIVQPYLSVWKLMGLRIFTTITNIQLAWNKLTGDIEESKQLETRLKEIADDITANEKIITDAGETIKKTVVDAIDTVVEGVSTYVKEANELGDKLSVLVKREQDLLKIRRAQEVQNAKSLADIEALKTIRDNEAESLEDRIKANEEIGEIEKKRITQAISLGQAELKLTKDRIALEGASTELLDIQKDQLIAIQELRSETAGIENEQVVNKTALLTEEFDKRASLIDKENELLSIREKNAVALADAEVQAQLDKLSVLRELGLEEKSIYVDTQNALEMAQATAIQTRLDTEIEASEERKALKEKNDAESIVQANKTAKQKAEIEKALGDAILNFASSLSSALGEESKSALLIQKTVALAQIGIDTAKAISSLTASSSANPANAISFGGAGAIQFATGLLTIGSNLAQAYSLLKQPAPQLNSTSSSGGQAPTTTQTAPDLGFQGRTAGAEQFGSQTVIKAFVTESDITTSQTNANNIQQLSQIG